MKETKYLLIVLVLASVNRFTSKIYRYVIREDAHMTHYQTLDKPVASVSTCHIKFVVF